MSPITTLLLLAIPLLTNATDKAYPPAEYYLVKGKCVSHYDSAREFTYKIIDVLSGPNSLKGEHFVAAYAGASSQLFRRASEQQRILLNNTNIKYGDEAYHWITVYRAVDGYLSKIRKIGYSFDRPPTPKDPYPPGHEVATNLVSLSMSLIVEDREVAVLKKVVPNPNRFPMTSDKLLFRASFSGPLDRQAEFESYVRAGKGLNISPPSKEIAEEWMAGMKEFCGTQAPEKREQLLEKYKASKNVYLAEWAGFVEKEYGKRTVPPKYDE